MLHKIYRTRAREHIILIIIAVLIVWGHLTATIHTHLYITSTSQLVQTSRYEARVIPNVWSDIT